MLGGPPERGAAGVPPALLLPLLFLAGCAAPQPAPSFHLGAAKIFFAPIADRSGHLTAAESASLRGKIVVALVALGEESEGKLDLVTREADADYALRLDVVRFEEARPVVALLVGFGAGRPGYAAEARIEAMGQVLARTEIARDRAALEAAPGGPRRAMLSAIAREVDRFLRRRR